MHEPQIDKRESQSQPEAQTDPVVDFHDKIAAQFSRGYEGDPGLRERLQVWSQIMRRRLHSADRVLDLGCGPGALTVEAARIARHVTAVDASASMLEQLNGRVSDGGFRNIAVCRQTFVEFFDSANTLYDAIICSSVIEYLDEPDMFLRSCANLLKPRGILLLSVPNGGSIFRIFERKWFHLTGRPGYYRQVRGVFREEDARNRLLRCGYQVAADGISAYGRPPFWWLLGDKTMLLLEAVKQASDT
jgi:2-polyprenyl-6-hydroxyphenyl methylase/3-demethylubiquinone-9 3-methyltransferase